MNKTDILDLFTINAENLSPLRISLILGSAVLAGLLIYAVYYFTTDKSVYSRSFNDGNVVLVLLSSVIMMMISSNIVISLGMVGALSIVRFRTAVKEARDTLYIFWSMVMGLCIGSQNFLLAAVSGLFISVVVLIMSYFTNKHNRYVLIVRAQGPDTGAIEKALGERTRHFKLQAMNDTEDGIEWVYVLSGKSQTCVDAATHVRAVPGVLLANLVGNTDEL